MVTTSKLQKQVAKTLKNMGVHVSEEDILEDSGFVVDIRLANHKVVIEVDGPSHFLQADEGAKGAGRGISSRSESGPRMNGSTLLKHRLLTQLGWTVVHVPYFEWDQCTTQHRRVDYMRSLLAPTDCLGT